MKLSKSKAMCYEQCPLKFRYRYIDQIEKPKSPALEKGIAVHTEIEKYINKESFGCEYVNVIDNVSEFLKKAEQKGFKPIKTELYVKDSEYNLHGYIDLILSNGEDIIVVDWKSGKPKTIGNHRFELALYAYMFQKQFGIMPISYGAFFVEHNIYVEEDCTAEIINKQLTKIDLIRFGINNECFGKTPNMFCKWCEYKEECENE